MDLNINVICVHTKMKTRSKLNETLSLICLFKSNLVSSVQLLLFDFGMYYHCTQLAYSAFRKLIKLKVRYSEVIKCNVDIALCANLVYYVYSNSHCTFYVREYNNNNNDNDNNNDNNNNNNNNNRTSNNNSYLMN